jgi:hypothetical protein
MESKFLDPEEFVNISRSNMLGGLYWRIAEKAYRSVLLSREKLTAINSELEPDKVHTHEMNIRDNGVVVIIFSALCLEAAAYDYAAIHLGDSYTKKYLDKLDPVSKWIIIPRLIIGTSFNQDGIAITTLSKLIKSRNSLVHAKSKKFNFDEFTFDKIELIEKRFNDEIDNAYSAIIYVALECDRIFLKQNLELTLEGMRYPIRHKRIRKIIESLRLSFNESLKKTSHTSNARIIK